MLTPLTFSTASTYSETAAFRQFAGNILAWKLLYVGPNLINVLEDAIRKQESQV